MMSNNLFKSCSVIIPTLNESSNIEELLTAIELHYPGIEVIVSDDGSTDGTQEKVLKFSCSSSFSVKLLDRSSARIHGLTASVLAAIDSSDREYLLIMDGDLQHPVEMINRLIWLLSCSADLALGARLPYYEDRTFFRLVVTKLSTWSAQGLLYMRGYNVSDPMSGLFGIRKNTFKSLIERRDEIFEGRGYKVLFELLNLSARGLSVKQAYYQFQVRSGGRSKLRPIHAFYFIRSLLRGLVR